MAPLVNVNSGAKCVMSMVDCAMIITVLLVIIGCIFNTEGSETVQDSISASVLAASSRMQELKLRQMHRLIIIVLNLIPLNC